ncbi:glycosyltransferase [Deinococcus sp.]|uniref:glycosyltransferase n=1 Tax=Deinococcus sp. TaxID=47478 RepID=UPI0025BE6168|nr:glycosyltransferase [Deinococcus sp.]
MNVVVAIPARDEGNGISRTLTALAAQTYSRPFEVLVLANNCQDDTAVQARAVARRQASFRLRVLEVTLPPEQANVVGARRLALETGAHMAGQEGIVVSTDADSEADPDWLGALIAPLEQGWAASAGRIQLRRAERYALPRPLRSVYLLDTGYRQVAAQLRHRVACLSEPALTHWQHFGANLALTVRAYRAVGGLPEVSCLEDMALVAALARADLPLCHTHAARVYTSARLSGRVPVGLSTQLGEWRSGPGGWRVPGGPELVAAAQAERLTRELYGTDMTLAQSAALRRAWRLQRDDTVTLDFPTSGLALEALQAARDQAGYWAAEFPPVPVRQALQEVCEALANYGGQGFRTR